MTGAHRPTADAGFALVQALASLVIVGMISLMLIAGAATGRRVWDRIDTGEAAQEKIEAAAGLLRERIEQTYPATKFEENPPVIDFQGTADTLSFLADPPDAGRPAPLRRYTLALDAAGRLTLSSVSDIAPAPGAPVDSQVLLANVRSLDIAYFGALRADRQRRWRGAWEDASAPPELVRVRVNFEPGDTRQWPDLVVRPRATIDSACLLNTETHRCKGRL